MKRCAACFDGKVPLQEDRLSATEYGRRHCDSVRSCVLDSSGQVCPAVHWCLCVVVRICSRHGSVGTVTTVRGLIRCRSNRVFRSVTCRHYRHYHIIIVFYTIALRPVFGPWPPRSPSFNLLSFLLLNSCSISGANLGRDGPAVGSSEFYSDRAQRWAVNVRIA
jgi:hypothetical protein